MTRIADYHQAVKARLIADPLVLQFDILREKRTADDGYLRARLTLDNREQLEFSEYVRRVGDQIQVVTYSFHWTDSLDKLVCRWDNAPHYPSLPQAPHHIHDGDQSGQRSSRRTRDDSRSARRNRKSQGIQASVIPPVLPSKPDFAPATYRTA